MVTYNVEVKANDADVDGSGVLNPQAGQAAAASTRGTITTSNKRLRGEGMAAARVAAAAVDATTTAATTARKGVVLVGRKDTH